MIQQREQTSSKEELKYKLQVLKEAIDADYLLQHLGFSISKSTQKEVRAPCRVHGGDNKSAFRMNKQTKNWVCFSHNCHEEAGYDVISLVMRMLNLDFSDAVRYLESITGLNIHDERSYTEYKNFKDRQEVIQQSGRCELPPGNVTEEYLENFRKFRSNYFEKGKNGGFPKEILDEFEVGGGYVDKYGFQRDVIPIRDKEGKLVAYSCRDITDKADYDYKYLLTEGFEKDLVLYNLHRAADCIGKSRTIVVTEGFKSVWKLYMAGYKNAVACMGSRLTDGQRNLLYSTAFRVITLFDGDEAGVKGTLNAIKTMKDKIDLIPLFLPYADKDPADYSIEELKYIIGDIE